MAQIICRNGQQHTHTSVAESRACWSTPAGVKHVQVTVAITDGFWVADRTGEVFKVQESGAGRLYGKRMNDGEFEFFSGAIAHLRKNLPRKLSVEEAKEFGRLYGRCIKCGRTLTDENSIAQGIGPICAESF